MRLAAQHSPALSIESEVYATARVRPLGDDRRPALQEQYLRALQTITPPPTILFGRFIEHTRRRPLAADPAQRVEVLELTEKATDVNLASQMVWDFHQHGMTHCLLMSSDLDYLHPLQLIRRVGVRIILLSPSRQLARDMRQVADTVHFLTPDRLAQAQLPDVIPTATGHLHCPHEWRHPLPSP